MSAFQPFCTSLDACFGRPPSLQGSPGKARLPAQLRSSRSRPATTRSTTIRVEGGRVTLRGVVERTYEKSCVEALAQRVPSVIGVLRRSGASCASGSGVCGAQPHAHQGILLQPGIRHLTCSLRWPASWLALDVAQDVPTILQCIMNGQRCRSFRGEATPGPVAPGIVALLPRRPAKRLRSQSRHVKAYVAVDNGRRCMTTSRE